jgi:DNA invertase Pin-like site-specific DNA recombinase
MKRAIGYVRVSTESQATDGVSLDMQAEKIRAYCSLYGYDLQEIIIDAGASAKTLDRPGIGRALESIRKGQADALVVYKLDRLTRSVRDLDVLLSGYFADGQAALVSVCEQVDTTTATGRMVLNILMSVAQWERETISERTTEAMAHKKAKGEYVGGRVPYGYRIGDDGVNLEAYGPEQDVISAIQTYRARGLKYREIVAALQADGVRTRTGGNVTISFVERTLKAETEAA